MPNKVEMVKKTAGRVIVRTGCIVCKARKVKCDERKPGCLRCEKAGRICEGYRNSAKPTQPAVESRALVPRADSSNSRARNLSSRSSLSFLHQPSTALFENENQRRYFDIFCTKTAKQLAGFLDSPVWDRLIPQACEREPSIRHMAIALGALDLKALKLRLIRPNHTGYARVREHHYFALGENQQAIKLLREASSKREIDLNIALIACIFCACFEAFHGSQDMVLTQVYSGIKLLQNASCVRGKEINDLVEDSPIGSPSRPLVEEELVSELRCLAYPGMNFQESISSDLTYSMRQLSVENMPRVFLNFKEALIYQESLFRRDWHFRRAIEQHDFEYDSSRVLNLKYTFEAFDSIIHPCSYIPPSTFEAHRSLMLEFRRWNDAFTPLWEDTKVTDGGSNFIMAATLKLQYLCRYIITENALSMSQTSYDAFLFTFIEINTLATALISHPKYSTKRSCLTLRSQYVMPVFVCALKCRHLPVRQQAMAILRSYPQIEGLWFSYIAVRVLSWVIKIEEEGTDSNGFIPENYRVRAVQALEYDGKSRMTRVGCRLLRCKNELAWRETFINRSLYDSRTEDEGFA